MHILYYLCVSNKERKSDGKKLTATENLSIIECGTLPTTVLIPEKTDDAWSKVEFQNMSGSKHTLVTP